MHTQQQTMKKIEITTKELNVVSGGSNETDLYWALWKRDAEGFKQAYDRWTLEQIGQMLRGF